MRRPPDSDWPRYDVFNTPGHVPDKMMGHVAP